MESWKDAEHDDMSKHIKTSSYVSFHTQYTKA